MSKEKFKFNEKTFQLEKVEVSLKQRFKQLGIHLGFSLTLAVVLIALSFPIVYRIMEREPIAQNQKLQQEYDLMNKEMEEINHQLSVLRMRDDSVYSGIFGVEPLAEELRVAGTGGADKTEHLEGYQNSELMISSSKKLEDLKSKFKVHKGRFDQISKLSVARSEKLAAIPAIQPIHNHNLIRTSSGFGMRVHPVYHVMKMHTGIDFTAKIGTEIYSTGKGKVVAVKNEFGGYGKHVVIKHGFGYETLYAHMNKFAVKVGDKVERGQLIGYVGNTGTSTGPHLHYEVIKDGRKINPANFFFNDLSYGEYSELLKIASSNTISLD